MVEIHCLSDGLFLIHIDKNELVDDILIEKSVGIAHTYHSTSDQHDFSFIRHMRLLP